MSTRYIVITAVVGVALIAAVVILSRPRASAPPKGLLESWLNLPAGLL